RTHPSAVRGGQGRTGEAVSTGGRTGGEVCPAHGTGHPAPHRGPGEYRPAGRMKQERPHGSTVRAFLRLSKKPAMRQAYAGFGSCSGQRRRIQREARLSWHSHLASFLRFMAANFSFTQLDTWAKPLYWV